MSSVTDPLDFSSRDDLAPVEVPVTLPDGRKCVLRSGSADAALRYRNHIVSHQQFMADGSSRQLDGFTDAEPLLIQACLFEKYEKANGHNGVDVMERPMTMLQIRGLYPGVLNALFKRAKEITPGLIGEAGANTIEQLDEVIDRLQKQRAILVKLRDGVKIPDAQLPLGGEEHVKNSPGAGTTTSA